MSVASTSFRVSTVRIDAVSLADASRWLVEWGLSGGGATMHLCNAHVLSLAASDSDYASVLNRGDLNVPDGMPVAWIGRYLGLPRTERVAGSELMASVLSQGREVGLRHYLYGSTPAVVAKLAAAVRRDFAGVDIVGVDSPPFRSLTDREEADLVDRIDASGAQVVWVGLGTPKQDVFVDRLVDRVAAVLVPVGAAFDFLAGTKPRAPAWMQRAGLEWLHRFASEPERLLRRYLVGNLRFAWAVLRERPRIERQA